jgi:hypothetical protein
MQRQRLTTISVLCALFVPGFLHAQSGGAVEGLVVDRVTGAGISGVSVYFGTAQGAHYEASTDESGAFRIAGMKPDEYGSHYEKAGYLPYYSGQDLPGVPTRVGSGPDPVRIRIELAAPGTLRGRVLDPDGKPANARVDLDLPSKDAVTDTEGRFVFTGLAPGDHTLLATPIKSAVAPEARASQEARTEVVPTWFPAAIERDQAQKIAVASGAAVSNIEIRLQSTPVFRVRGVVLNAAGKPEPHVSLMMASAAGRETLTGFVQEGEFGFFPLGVPTLSLETAGPAVLSNGAFELSSVRPGDWRFIAIAEPSDDSDGPATSVVTSVLVEHDIDDLEIRFAAPFQWKGSVEWQDSPAAGRFPKVNVILAAENRWAMTSGSQPDGTLRFDHIVPGQYRVVPAPGAEGNYYLSSVLFGEREVLGQPVTLLPGSPPLRIVYKPNAGTIRGTVDNCEKATVVLVPEQALTDLSQDSGRVSACGSEGEFSISSVRPGDYYVWALDTADTKRFTDPRVLQKAIPNAVRVTVDEAATASVKLIVTHVPLSW